MADDEKVEAVQDGQNLCARPPTVAVVVPVYNGERFIEETIRSAAAQSFPNLKIIAIDNGSTDRSQEILENLKKSVPNLEVHKTQNNGVARARNRGTELADTDYVAFMDQDDIWHTSKIEKQITALLKHSNDPSWAGCYTANRVIDEYGQLLRTGTAFPARGFIFGSHLVMNHVGNGSNFLVRRSAALEVGGFDSSYFDQGIGGLEDRDFQLRFLRRYRVEYVPECLVGYRMYGGTMSSKYEELALGVIVIIDKFSSDNKVPAALRRVAMSAAHRYAALRFFLARKYWLALRHFMTQLWLDPLFGPPVALSKTWHRSQDRIRYRSSRQKDRTSQARQRPTFHSLEPTDMLTEMNARRPKYLERWLAKMDRLIEP